MINCEQINGIMKVSYVDTDGSVAFEDIPIPPKEQYNWEYSNTHDKKYISWDNKPVRKVKSKYLNKYRQIEFLQSQSESIKQKIFANNIPRKYFIDIETEVIDGFPNIRNPKEKITVISMVSDKDKIITLGTIPVDDAFVKNVENKTKEYFQEFNKKIEYKYIYFETEYDMLYTFLAKYLKKMTLVSGWNVYDFDWTYILARCTKIYNIDCGIASHTGKLIEIQHPLQDKNKQRSDAVVPIHKMFFDYQTVYKKWDTTIDIKERDSLDWVSEAVLGKTKIKYNGNLQDLYESDYFTYVYYNVVDSYLVRLLDERLNTLAVPLSLGSLCCVEYSSVWTPVPMVETVMAMQLYKENKVFVKVKKDIDDKKYTGAYVMDPQLHELHTDVAAFDYASLYPTTIRQHNISPEVFIEKSPGISDDPNVISCASGAKFKKDQMGVLPIVLTNIYKDRKKYKKMSGDYENDANFLKTILKQRFDQ